MIYIDFIKDKKELLKEEEKEYIKLIKKILIYFRKIFNYITINKTEYGDILKIQNLKSGTYKKIEKIFKINNVQIVCLSEKLNKNKEFEKFLNNNKVRKVNGKWLNGYLLLELIEYIAKNKEEKSFHQEVSFLINKNNYLMSENIYKISKQCKNVNIITDKVNQFKSLENKIYEEEGVSINIGNNYKKSLLNSNIIINVDFSEEQINKYNIPKYSSIININDYIKINKKSFEGINIYSVRYIINKEFDEEFKNFDNNLMYESLISRNSNHENVFKQMKKDCLKIVEVYGKNGIIGKKEFLKLKRIYIN